MTPEQFCYWLRGALELWPNVSIEGLTGEQVQKVNAHLDLVMKPVTATAPQKANQNIKEFMRTSERIC